EADILANKEDPDLAYNQIIRPWKSRLGLLYVQYRGLPLYTKIIALTCLGFVSRSGALAGVNGVLQSLQVDQILIETALRQRELDPYPPPGMTSIVKSRSISRIDAIEPQR